MNEEGKQVDAILRAEGWSGFISRDAAILAAIRGLERKLATLSDNFRIAEKEHERLHRELGEARDLAAECERVITAMEQEDGWPPARLAPRLFRLRTLARIVLTNERA